MSKGRQQGRSSGAGAEYMEITGRNSSVSSGHCSADMGDRHLCRTAHKSRRSFNGADTFRRR